MNNLLLKEEKEKCREIAQGEYGAKK